MSSDRTPEPFEQYPGETWRDVVKRVAEKQGLALECLELFDFYAGNMQSLDTAAWSALYEWDCL
jgi:hypothetical protein